MMFCYQESRQPAKVAEAGARISAYSSRHGGNTERQKQQVEEWYRDAFRTQPERMAATSCRVSSEGHLLAAAVANKS